MKVNFVTQILHATKKLVSPRGDIEDLNSDTIKARLITATETLKSEKDLNVTGKDGTATIRDLDVTDTADVKNKLTVENDTKTKNLEVAPDKNNNGGNATIHNAIIKSLDNDSEAWATDENEGTAKDLMTDLGEFKPTHPNESTAGTSTKVARADHVHKIPNAIKNPFMLKIKGYGDGVPVHAYDGSRCEVKADEEVDGNTHEGTGNTLLEINYDFTGAAKKNHASSETVFGVGNVTNYGHTKLHETDFGTYNKNNDSTNTTVIDNARNLDVNSGTALTPSSLAKYAGYIKEYLHENYIEIPENPKDPVEFNWPVNFNELVVFKNRLRIKDGGYFDGYVEGQANFLKNRVKLYGVNNSKIGKLQFGRDDNRGKSNVILTSNQDYTANTDMADSHLYIEHDYENYISKVSDFEIECIITPQTSKHNRVWVPSKAGLYRIFLIGGGGFGSEGVVVDKFNHGSNGSSWIPADDYNDGPHHGYGLGTAIAGIGGGGGPVVEIDLLTSESEAAVSNGEYIPINGATCSSPGGRGSISITARYDNNGTITYDCSISITNIIGGSLSSSDGSISSATIRAGTCQFSVSNISCPNLTISEEKNDDNTTYYNVTGGSLVVGSVTTNISDCELSGGNASTANMYTINSVTITNITVEYDTSDDSTIDGSDESEDEREDSEDGDNEGDIGARFVFFKSKIYTARSGTNGTTRHVTRKTTDGTADLDAYRSVGVQKLASIGKVVNVSGSLSNMTSEGNPKLTYAVLKGVYGITGMSGAESSTATTALMKDEIDAFAGHGMDAATIKDNKNGAQHVDDIPLGTITSVLKESDRPYYDNSGYRYIVSDRTTDRMHGGSKQMTGMNGYSFRACQSLNPAPSNITDSEFNSYGKKYASQNGYDGGCPGMIGITGGLPAKGSLGAVSSKVGRVYGGGGTRQISFKGGTGASFELHQFDGYNGSIYHSDRTSSATQLILPGKNSKVGGFGYLGGGHGGGGAMVANITSNYSQVKSKAYTQSWNRERKKLEPCVVIIYLGKQGGGSN